MLKELELINPSNLTTHIESLRYARLIQQGLLPKKRHFNRLFNDHFVIYKPLNYVSGDFYWVGGKGDLSYLAVGDCTGHGVPGAMLSVLARSILEYSIMNKGLTKTHKILHELDKKFIESFSGINGEFYNNDWVDLALVCIDKKNKKIYFSSAKRKMLFIDKNEARLIDGEPFPIGGWQMEEKRNFKSTVLDFSEGDTIYLGSDGYQDQIGGDKMKKFSSRRLHDLLGEVHELKMSEQKNLLLTTFTSWKAMNDQVDDICIVGIRL